MQITWVAIVPVLLLMLFGNILRRTGFLQDSFWQLVEKLIFYILFPALLIVKIASVDLQQYAISSLLLFLVVFLILLSLLSFILCKLCGTTNAQHGSVYQSLIRFNSYVFFALIQALWGEGYLAVAALVAGVFVPMVNILSVAGYARAAGDIRLQHTLIAMLKNPFIIAAIIGFVVNQYPILLPEAVFDTLEILSRATLPLALLCVGAAVRVTLFFGEQIGYSKGTLSIVILSRLLLVPLICILLLLTFDFARELQQILIILAAVPTATSSHILAARMHGDVNMMVALVSAQTMLCALTLMLWVNVSYWFY